MAWLSDRIFGSAEDRWYRTFCRDADAASLTELLARLADVGKDLHLENEAVREALRRVSDWSLTPHLLEILFARLERFLMSSATPPDAGDWKVWMDIGRRLNRPLSVRSPRLAAGLLRALSGLTDGHPFALNDRRTIVAAVEQFAVDVLEDSSEVSSIDVCRAIAILASMGHSGDSSKAFGAIRGWWERVTLKPLAFEFVSDAQALDAPVRGVGSPNGVVLTTVYVGSRLPVRLLSAGRTPDALINSWLDDAIFATALTCDAEPTILSTVGSVLSLSGRETGSRPDEAEPLV